MKDLGLAPVYAIPNTPFMRKYASWFAATYQGQRGKFHYNEENWEGKTLGKVIREAWTLFGCKLIYLVGKKELRDGTMSVKVDGAPPVVVKLPKPYPPYIV